MKHDKLIAVMLVAIMTTTAVSAVALSTTPAVAAPATATQIKNWGSYDLLTFAPNSAPAAGQTFILYGQLLTWNNIALAGKNIEIWQRLPSQTVGTQLKTVQTLAAGAFATTTSATQPTYYRALFRGDGANAACMSPLFLVSAGAQYTHISLRALDTSGNIIDTCTPSIGTGVVFYLGGRLVDSNGNGMGGRTVNIWYRYNTVDQTGGKILDSTSTDALGYFQVLTSMSQTPTFFRAVYNGETGFIPASSNCNANDGNGGPPAFGCLWAGQMPSDLE